MKIVILALALILSGCTSGGVSRYDPYYDERYYDDPVTSDNWECTSDCSGHEAGYEWADENGITDPDDCGGNSDSFIEGCEAYANEYTSSLRDDEYDMYYDDARW